MIVKNKIFQQHTAFTLAEVLITLMVIGIIAAMTIPSVLQSYKERETISKLKATYSILQQAYKLTEIEDGLPDTWNLSATNPIGNMNNHLKILKECPGDTEGCAYTGYYKFLNGNDYPYQKTPIDSAKKYILVNGATIISFQLNKTCTGTGQVNGVTSCAWVYIDLNNSKPPNQWGKDLFAFNLTKQGFSPWGGNAPNTSYTHNSYCRNTDAYGLSCAAWVITKGNMDYLHKTTNW